MSLPCGAERTRQAAPHLAADAGRHPFSWRESTPLDHFPGFDGKGAFDRAVAADLLFFSPNGESKIFCSERARKPCGKLVMSSNRRAPLVQSHSADLLAPKSRLPKLHSHGFEALDVERADVSRRRSHGGAKVAAYPASVLFCCQPDSGDRGFNPVIFVGKQLRHAAAQVLAFPNGQAISLPLTKVMEFVR